jgi:hypothetical protein
LSADGCCAAVDASSYWMHVAFVTLSSASAPQQHMPTAAAAGAHNAAAATAVVVSLQTPLHT